jgi:hypothetical protein
MTDESRDTTSRDSSAARLTYEGGIMVFENRRCQVAKTSCILLSEGRGEQAVPEVLEEDDLTDFRPFVYKGIASRGVDMLSRNINILRDTGSAVSVLLAGRVPLTDAMSILESVVLRGVSLEAVETPLHWIFLN